MNLSQVRKTCASFAESMKKLSDRNFLFVRYEDMSAEPLHHAEKVYEFIGHQMPSDVRNWIVQNTNGSVNNQSTYSTGRNSTETMTAWRTSISIHDVSSLVKRPNPQFFQTLEVQQECADFMKIAGYQLVSSDANLADSTFPVYVDWERQSLM